MKKKVFLFPILLLICTCSVAGENSPRRLILDTDLSSDADDVGAVAVLHAMAREHIIEILATMISSGDPYSAPALTALNRYFGRPDLPIGIVFGPGVTHESSYSRALAESLAGAEAVSIPSVD